MIRAKILASGCALAATLAVSAVYAGHGSARGRVTPPYITRAVGDSARPEADTKRDADRHPALTLAVAGVKPGDQVAELIPGAGYFTRLLSAVVGPRGKVYAVVPPRRPDAPADQPDPAARLQPITSASHYRNVTVSVQKVAQLELRDLLHAHRHVAVVAGGGDRLQASRRIGLIGGRIGAARRHHRVDLAPGADHGAQQAREITRSRNQLGHLVAGFDARNGESQSRMAIRVALGVRFRPRTIADRPRDVGRGHPPA